MIIVVAFGVTKNKLKKKLIQLSTMLIATMLIASTQRLFKVLVKPLKVFPDLIKYYDFYLFVISLPIRGDTTSTRVGSNGLFQ